jgi:hypothetical protein
MYHDNGCGSTPWQVSSPGGRPGALVYDTEKICRKALRELFRYDPGNTHADRFLLRNARDLPTTTSLLALAASPGWTTLETPARAFQQGS